MGSSRLLRGSLLLLLLLLATCLRWTAGQTVTVSARNVIAIRGVDGHDFTKFCSVTDVSSSAIEAIQWLKGDEIVETDNVDPLDESHFFISNGAITADMAGHYYCRALIMGDLTDRSSAGQLTVLENEVIVAPTPQYAVLGSSIELQCTIEADGLTIRDTWAVGDSNFDTGLNNLSPVEMEHEGPYTCRLIDVNEEMEDVERVIEFRVTVPPVITVEPDSHYSFTGDTFQTSISVSYKGRQGDTSAVVWMRDGVTLATSGEGYEIVETFDTAEDLVATTSLMFLGNYLSRSFEGHYSVVITNDNDVIPTSERTASTSFSISVTVLPAAITDVNVTTKTPLSALVQWAADYRHEDEHPDNVTILVEDMATGVTSSHLVGDPVSARSAEVGVVPGVEYSVTMESANRDGRNRTLPTTFATAPDAPSVSDVRVSRLNSTAFKLTTQLHYTGGGSISLLIVSFRVLGDNSVWSDSVSVPAVPESDDRLEWSGVVSNPEFAQYALLDFRVYAENQNQLVSVDGTAYSEPLVLPPAPVSIKAIATTTSSAVLEVVLSPEGTPPMIVVMELTSHPELGCCGNQTTYVRGGSVRFVLEGLARDTTYTVSVVVVNHSGQGGGTQQSFSTDGDEMVLPLWQTVLIGVCGAIALIVLTILFCLLLCCGCKASRKWGRKEYHTGPIEMAHRELERNNPMLTRSIRSNGYAGSQVSFGSNQGRPLTPRTPTGLSVTSPSFEYTDAPKYDLNTSRMNSSAMSPFHDSSREKLTHTASVSHLYYPTYPNDFPEEAGYQSLPRGMDSGFPFGSLTLSPPPAPAPCSTDV